MWRDRRFKENNYVRTHGSLFLQTHFYLHHLVYVLATFKRAKDFLTKIVKATTKIPVRPCSIFRKLKVKTTNVNVFP